jgi:hypothetical protein
MGDRGNIIIKDNASDVTKTIEDAEMFPHPLYCYTHWTGSNLPGIVKNALKRAQKAGRLSNPAYLARILFCEMVGDDNEGETGYGLSTSEGDGGTEVHVDPANSKVRIGEDGPWLTFKVFIEQPDADAEESSEE